MTRFWHRRSSEAIAVVAAALSGLFAWGYFGGTNALNHALTVPLISGGLAAFTLVAVILSYFTASFQHLKQSAALNYALLVATIVALIIQTGGITSSYIGLFVAALSFAGFFGLAGVVAGTSAFAVFITQQYLNNALGEGQVVLVSVLCALPLVCSFILWSRSSQHVDEETKEDRSYHELANELSQVAGKSDVVINAISEGVLALNSQGTIELINPAAEQLLGWGKHDALTLSYKSILKMKDAKNQDVVGINDPVAQVLADNKPIKNDNFSIVTNSGKTFIASITVNPVGQLGQGVIVVFRDITAEKSDERQRAEFISTASHEMRTPVASIEGYLGLALNPQTATIDAKARDFITKAHESAQHLGRLFSDLLDVSKADDSRLKNDPKIVDVVPFVHDIVQGLTPKAIEKGLRVLYKPMPDGAGPSEHDSARKLNPVYYANVDNDHLREVVQNLVENAIKYTLKGEVIVDVSGDENHVVVSVADTGIGIPREDQTHLFQKFYRVDNSDTREIGGTGLGLYLCRRLAETMGGRIWVESEYKRGSTFFVEVPRTDHDDAQRLIEQASLGTAPEPEPAPEIILDRQQAPLGAPVQVQAPSYAASVSAEPAPLAAPVAPAPAPVAPPAPAAPQVTPIVPTTLPEPQVLRTNVPAPPVRQAPVNTPLTAIEANPSQYINRPVGGVVVPRR